MIKDNIFHIEELEKLPLTYRKFNKIKKEEFSELKERAFAKSAEHRSEYYLIVYPIIPYSNFIII